MSKTSTIKMAVFSLLIFMTMALFSIITLDSAFAMDESLIVTESGDVGVGVITPESKLHVNGRIKDKTGFVMPVGTILPFGGATAPAGWLLCDGSVLERAGAYADLFAAIGTAFGAPTGTTFNVPDLRGMFLRGVDNGAQVDPDAAGRQASMPGGNTGDSVGSKQNDELEAHNHYYSHFSHDSGEGNAYGNYSKLNVPTRQTTNAGGAETRPVNINVNFIIKY